MKVCIGTRNQKKIDVTQSVFKSIFNIADIHVIGRDVASNVPEAPHGKQTYDGAHNRAVGCSQYVQADYYVGVESGLVERYGSVFEEAWAVVLVNGGPTLLGYSSGLCLPQSVVVRMQGGEKHNEIMAAIDKQFNLPDDNRDTWSRYTGGNISRQVSIEEALRNALIQAVPSERNLYHL